MFVALLALLFFAIPFAEIFVIVQVANVFGAVNTLLLMVLMSSAGAWLVKREGTESWKRVVTGLKTGRMPTTHVVDGFLLLVAGVMLLTPGFITGTAGILLALPPVREVARGIVIDRFKARMVRRDRSSAGNRGPYSGGFGSAPPFSAGAFVHEHRPYSRPEADEPAPSRSSANVWERGDIIDVEGEEWYLDEEPRGEIGPASP